MIETTEPECTTEEANARQAARELLDQQMKAIKALDDSIKLSVNLSPDDPITQVHHLLREAYEALYEAQKPLVWGARFTRAADDDYEGPRD